MKNLNYNSFQEQSNFSFSGGLMFVRDDDIELESDVVGGEGKGRWSDAWYQHHHHRFNRFERADVCNKSLKL